MTWEDVLHGLEDAWGRLGWMRFCDHPGRPRDCRVCEATVEALNSVMKADVAVSRLLDEQARGVR